MNRMLFFCCAATPYEVTGLFGGVIPMSSGRGVLTVVRGFMLPVQRRFLDGVIPVQLHHGARIELLPCERGYLDGVIPGQLHHGARIELLPCERGYLDGVIPGQLHHGERIELLPCEREYLDGVIPGPIQHGAWNELNCLHILFRCGTEYA